MGGSKLTRRDRDVERENAVQGRKGSTDWETWDSREENTGQQVLR